MTRYLSISFLILASCSPKLGTHISMDNSQIIYRGFDNHFEYSYDCGDCSKNLIKVEGGSFRTIDSEEKGIYRGVFQADSISNTATITSFCICEHDTVEVKTKSYPIIEIPRPQIFLGGVNLTDYSIYDQAVSLDTSGIVAKYISHPSIAHIKFLIPELSITFKEKEQKLTYNLSKNLNTIFRNMSTKEQATINYLILWYPSNKKEKIYLNRTITRIESGDHLQFILK